MKEETVRALAAFEMYEVGVAMQRAKLQSEHGDCDGVAADWDEWKRRPRQSRRSTARNATFAAWIDASRCSAAAVSMRTEPRFTHDVDLAVAVDSDEDAERSSAPDDHPHQRT